MAGFTFNRVVIVESLGAREFNSGEELHKYLIAVEGLADIPIEYVKCPSATAFLEILEELTILASQGIIPLLHIETHGADDHTGLVFQDDSFLSWGELAARWVPLNRATGFNLLVVVAACFGAHFLLSDFKLRSASPFWGLIGPTNTTHGPELLGSFRSFYRNLLNGATASSVFASLGKTRLDAGELLFQSAESLFLKGIIRYLEKFCSAAFLRSRANKNRKKLKKLGRNVSLGHALRSLAHAHDDFAFDNFADNYFMLQDLPDNRKRFSATLGQCKARFLSVGKS